MNKYIWMILKVIGVLFVGDVFCLMFSNDQTYERTLLYYLIGITVVYAERIMRQLKDIQERNSQE